VNILLTGATGLIGSSVAARLAMDGHQVTGVIRRGPAGLALARTVTLDMAKALDPADWLPHLAGADAVVNCAGVLQDSASEQTREVHAVAAAALFAACERAGVRRVIHLSAIGVDRERPSSFSASKHAGDQALMASDLDWIILRPSVVLGRRVFGASALFRGLAALPLLPMMPDTGRLQVVQLDEVVATVSFFLDPASPSRLSLELAGPEPLAMAEVIGLYRSWLGRPAAKVVSLPGWAAGGLYRIGDLAGALGWRPPIRSNAGKEIRRGAVGDPSAWMAVTGIRLRPLRAALAADPATAQEKWFAGLYFIKPVIFTVLPFFWIMTGLVSLTTGFRNGVELMISTGAGALSGPAVIAGALADIAVGTLMVWRPTSRLGLQGAIALSAFYLIAGSVLRPDLWNEPLGPLLKILPILVLHFVAMAILDER
jgi:uncharacterized protein YbjT (DUF2867 family)